MSFEELNLPDFILKAVNEIGFTSPTDIQKNAIPHILNGFDIIGKSRTGTGKTAAFSIPIICNINKENKKSLSSLILCPTRELAMQVCDEIRKYGKYNKNINVISICGGQSYDKQIQGIKNNANIIVGTPGRIIDHINRGTLKLHTLKSIVLDEADEMLNMGFIDDIEKILSCVPEKKQVILFSATMPKDILSITKKYQDHPVVVDIKNNTLKVNLIEQFYCLVNRDKKTDALHVLLKYADPKLAIIFCNTKKMVDELEVYLSILNFNVAALHGDMKQSARSSIMNKFKSGKINILIATDVAARGIDVNGVDIVINYDLPQDIEYYVHRIGRTGRAGKSGKSYTLISNQLQYNDLIKIKQKTDFKMEQFLIPSPKELQSVIRKKFVEELNEYITEYKSNIYYEEPCFSDDEKQDVSKIDKLKHEQEILNILLEKGITPEQVALSLISLVAPKDQNNIPFVNNLKQDKFSRNKKLFSKDKFKKLTLNVGKKHYSNKSHLIKSILTNSKVSSSHLGRIDILNDITTIEVLKSKADIVEKNIHNSKIGSNIVKVLKKISFNKSKSNK